MKYANTKNLFLKTFVSSSYSCTVKIIYMVLYISYGTINMILWSKHDLKI